jgi:hypothetical protein
MGNSTKTTPDRLLSGVVFGFVRLFPNNPAVFRTTSGFPADFAPLL